MTDQKKAAEEIRDQDLDSAQGGAFPDGTGTMGGIGNTVVNINNDYRMTNSWQPVQDAVNINNDYQTTDSVAVNINNDY